MTRIVLLSGANLCQTPRVLKEALALSGAGFHVEVLAGWTDPVRKAQDLELVASAPFHLRPVVDLTSTGVGPAAGRLGRRIRTRAGHLVYGRLGYANVWQLGHALGPLLRAARAARGDLLVAHTEVGMQVASELVREGARVGIDVEDWFSEDLSLEDRKMRPVPLLRSLEGELLRGSTHTTCPSRSMADALAKAFNCSAPRVVYNAFPWADRTLMDGEFRDRRTAKVPSIHWYSQSLGPGRGLEDLFAAIPLLASPVEIHLRGNPVQGTQAWLDRSIAREWRDRVFVHPQVPGHELLSRIAEHDIGFAGEVPFIPNKNLTVSNKILHYLLGGLAVVASDTAGQREIAHQAAVASGTDSRSDDAGPVLLYPSGDSQALADRLNPLLVSSERLATARACALRAAKLEFCWERQVPSLVASVKAALEVDRRNPPRPMSSIER